MTTGMDATGAPDDLNELKDELRHLLARAAEGKLRHEEIDTSANLFDFGYVDSLTGVVFLAEIEERFGVEIDDMDLVERINTLDALAAHVAEHRE